MKPSSVNAGNLVTIAALVAARYRKGEGESRGSHFGACSVDIEHKVTI